MRKLQRKTDDEVARSLLQHSPEHHLATSTESGDPVLRVLNGVLVRNWLLFHGAIGEKSECMGRRAVVSVHRTLADIPSHFVDEQKACPATTYYQSAQAKGVLTHVSDVVLKAEMMQALMDKLQPEGGYVPIAPDADLYRKDLRAVRVFGFEIEEITGKASLGQDRPCERTERVVRGLWKRGKNGDLAAIEEILHLSPAARPLEWTLEGGIHLVVFADEELSRQHAGLLEGSYWREEIDPAEVQVSILESCAWVGALNDRGELLGAARASSDRKWIAQICDVVVRPELQGRGLGTRLMQVLLDHPYVRNCRHQRLGTRDKMDFYARFGFVREDEQSRSFASVRMSRPGEST